MEANRQLSDPISYKKLNKNPTVKFKKELEDLISTALEYNIIADTTANFLNVEHPKTAIFHYLPKTHKRSRPP
ncbi:hypothetical protein XELAEV_180099042mg, partial [Xenopus laevis]